MDRSTRVLLIDDSDEDFQTVHRLLSKIAPLSLDRCPDASAAFCHLQEIWEGAPGLRRLWPSFILLDLNMPGEDGRSLLARLKADPRFCRIPVVILTTSGNPQDVEFCYRHGAAGYIVKPVDLARFRASLEQAIDYWLGAVCLPPMGGKS